MPVDAVTVNCQQLSNININLSVITISLTTSYCDCQPDIDRENCYVKTKRSLYSGFVY